MKTIAAIFRALIFTGEEGRERSLSQGLKRRSKEGSLIFLHLLHSPILSNSKANMAGPINDRKLVTALTHPDTTPFVPFKNYEFI